MCFAPRRRAIFMSLLKSYLRTRRFSNPTFRTSGTTNHWKNTAIRDFPNIFRACIFFLVTLLACWSSFYWLSWRVDLLSTDLNSLRLCFSTVHIVGSWTSKLPLKKHRKSPVAVKVARASTHCQRHEDSPQEQNRQRGHQNWTISSGEIPRAMPAWKKSSKLSDWHTLSPPRYTTVSFSSSSKVIKKGKRRQRSRVETWVPISKMVTKTLRQGKNT